MQTWPTTLVSADQASSLMQTETAFLATPLAVLAKQSWSMAAHPAWLEQLSRILVNAYVPKLPTSTQTESADLASSLAEPAKDLPRTTA